MSKSFVYTNTVKNQTLLPTNYLVNKYINKQDNPILLDYNDVNNEIKIKIDSIYFYKYTKFHRLVEEINDNILHSGNVEKMIVEAEENYYNTSVIHNISEIEEYNDDIKDDDMLKRYYMHCIEIYIFLKAAVIFSINYKFTTTLLKELKLKDNTESKDTYNKIYDLFKKINTEYVKNFETVLKHFITVMNKITDYYLTEFKSGDCSITNKDYVLLLNHANILNLYNLTLNIKNNDSNPVSYKYYKGPGNKSIFYKYMNIKYNKHLFDTKYYLNEKNGIEHAHSKLMNDYFMVYNKKDFNKIGAKMYEDFTFKEGGGRKNTKYYTK